VVGIVLNSSHQFSSLAKNEDVLGEIAKYKTWTKITGEPIKVGVDELASFG
jgi:hypothetical protein